MDVLGKFMGNFLNFSYSEIERNFQLLPYTFNGLTGAFFLASDSRFLG